MSAVRTWLAVVMTYAVFLLFTTAKAAAQVTTTGTVNVQVLDDKANLFPEF